MFGLSEERYNKLKQSPRFMSDESIKDYIRIWGIDGVEKGYSIFNVSGSDVIIEDALTIEEIGELNYFDGDFKACRQAEKDGVKFINDIEGLEKGCYVDTPKNRKHCKEMLEKYPEYRIENWIDWDGDYGQMYSEVFGK